MEKQEKFIVLKDGDLTMRVPLDVPIALCIPPGIIGDPYEALAVRVMNLLRCGCPTVQLIGSMERWKQASVEIHNNIKLLELDSESIVIKYDKLPIMKVFLKPK